MKNLTKIFTFTTLIVLLFSNNTKANFKTYTDFKIESSSVSLGEEFNKGWAIGWCEGWKDVKGQYSYCPSVPYPPYPKYGTDSFKGGYNAGFKYGRCMAEGYENCKKQ